MTGPLTREYAAGALMVISYLTDLFTTTPKDSFSREQLLVILNTVMHDPELLSPEDVAAFQRACDEIDAEDGQ